MSKPLISIIGRPNVGKSTLINRLAGKRVCIVDDQPGVTRDRKYIDVDWSGFPFTVVDTGGLLFNDNSTFSEEILEQAGYSLASASGIVFVVDGTAGVTKADYEVAKFLRGRNGDKPIYLAVNKVDNPDRLDLMYEFYELGFDEVFPISAIHGSQGLGDLLSSIKDRFHDRAEEIEEEATEINVAIVGKPNVGKSSLFNKLLGESRSIVSDHSGTTRDAIDTKLKRHSNVFNLVDTAGLRRKSKVGEDVEYYSNMRTINAIERSDVVLLMVDATEEEIITDQDKKIASLVIERGKACVVLINKWDLVKEKSKPEFLKDYKAKLDHKLKVIKFAPKEFISAATGQRTDNIWKMIVNVNEEHKRRISTGLLNKVVNELSILNPPPVVKQKVTKIKYASQVSAAPPMFLFFTNNGNLLPESYKRFLERQIREYFGFEGTPIVLKFRSQDSTN